MLGTEIAYKEYIFKSKIEFSWAQKFEGDGLEWKYEPVTFREGRAQYTPDFGVELFYVETKVYGAKNVQNLFYLCHKPLLLIFGVPERCYIRFKPANAKTFLPGHLRSWTLAYQKVAA